MVLELLSVRSGLINLTSFDFIATVYWCLQGGAKK